MIDMTTAPFGALILRLALAFLFFAHVYLKLFIFKPAGTVGFFKSLGLPGWFAYVTIVWEILGATALLLGFMPRLAALAMIPVMAGTVVKVHGPAGFWFTNPNGGWEYPVFWIVTLLVFALLGDGAAAIVATPALF